MQSKASAFQLPCVSSSPVTVPPDEDVVDPLPLSAESTLTVSYSFWTFGGFREASLDWY